MTKNDLMSSFSCHVTTLADAVSSPLSFGRLTSLGVNLDQLIASESSLSSLEAALDKLRQVGDLRWIVRISRRLVDLSDLPKHHLELARCLVWANDFEGADAALRQTSPSTISPNAHALIECQIAIGRRDRERALRAIATVQGLGDDPTPWHARLISALMSAGEWTEAIALHRASVDSSGMSPSLAALDVRLCLIQSGPKAALDRLDQLSTHLPIASEAYRALKIFLLSLRGRYNEALDFALVCLAQSPLSTTLYAPAMDAAQHCDRVIELGKVLTEIDLQYPGVPDLIETLCNFAIDQGNDQRAAELLEDIRERSTWDWMILRFGEACQNPNNYDVDAFLSMLIDDGVSFAGPHIMHALFNYYFNVDAAGIGRAQSSIANLISKAMDDSGLIALHLRLLIAQNRDGEAKAFFSSLPNGLQSTAVLAPFGLYFLAQDGRHSEARHGWTRYLSDCGHMALNARSSYPEDVNVRYSGQQDDILAFITVFNGIEYLEWFLAYYRKLGVAHFFFCDNGSTDGTFEYLLTQPDVSLFSNKTSFAASACGVFWTNHLMRRFGVGHWCLHLDMDEALVFPGHAEGRSLRDFTIYLDSRGFEATTGCMVDIFPDALGDNLIENPFEESCFIDTDYVWMRNELPPYHFVKGGVRSRVTGRSLMMTKAPLVKMRADLAYIANNHQLSHAVIADVSVVLLHYKFIGAFRDRVDEAVDRQEHFQGARFYRVLQTSFGKQTKSDKMVNANTLRYTNSSQLEEIDILTSSRLWGNSYYIMHEKRRG